MHLSDSVEKQRKEGYNYCKVSKALVNKNSCHRHAVHLAYEHNSRMQSFSAERTNGRAVGTVLRSSVVCCRL